MDAIPLQNQLTLLLAMGPILISPTIGMTPRIPPPPSPTRDLHLSVIESQIQHLLDSHPLHSAEEPPFDLCRRLSELCEARSYFKGMNDLVCTPQEISDSLECHARLYQCLSSTEDSRAAIIRVAHTVLWRWKKGQLDEDLRRAMIYRHALSEIRPRKNSMVYADVATILIQCLIVAFDKSRLDLRLLNEASHLFRNIVKFGRFDNTITFDLHLYMAYSDLLTHNAKLNDNKVTDAFNHHEAMGHPP